MNKETAICSWTPEKEETKEMKLITNWGQLYIYCTGPYDNYFVGTPVAMLPPSNYDDQFHRNKLFKQF